MKTRLLYLSLLLSTIGCSKHQNENFDTHIFPTSDTQPSSVSASIQKNHTLSVVTNNTDCVKTEGDYETDLHCVRISNVGNRTESEKIYFDIIDKKSSHKERHEGEVWGLVDKKGNVYTFGFHAKNGGKLYEIDWRDDNATYFRIWDSKRQHKYLEEKVIRGPKELLDEAEKAVGKASKDEE